MHEILEILAGVIQDESKAILFSSHITSDLEKIADYVTFINHGKIVVFSENKDDVLHRFFVIRGPKSDLKPALESRMIGLGHSAFGFEGLCSDIDAVKPGLSGACVVEKANFDQIMIFFARDGQKNRRGGLPCWD